MSKKLIEPYWITREEAFPRDDGKLITWADLHFAIIPKIAPGLLTTKIFYLPFTFVECTHKLTYRGIIEKVGLDLQGRYNCPGTMYGFDRDGNFIEQSVQGIDISFDDMLSMLMQNPGEFFDSTDPWIKMFRRLFAQLIQRSRYGGSANDRRDARKRIDELLQRPPGYQNRNIIIPSFLYLDGLLEYIHKITFVLKNSLDNDPKAAHDMRLKFLSDEHSFSLRTHPKLLSQELAARCLSLELDTFQSLLKEERGILQKPTPAHKHLVFKLPSQNR